MQSTFEWLTVRSAIQIVSNITVNKSKEKLRKLFSFHKLDVHRICEWIFYFFFAKHNYSINHKLLISAKLSSSGWAMVIHSKRGLDISWKLSSTNNIKLIRLCFCFALNSFWFVCTNSDTRLFRKNCCSQTWRHPLKSSFQDFGLGFQSSPCVFSILKKAIIYTMNVKLY